MEELTSRPQSRGELDRDALVEELCLAPDQKSIRDGGNPRSLVIRPADSTRRDTVAIETTTTQVYASHVIAAVPRPIGVGDYYALALDGSHQVHLARCDRLTLVEEERFEARLRIVEPSHQTID